MFIKILTIAPLPLAGLRCAMAALTFLPLLRPFKSRPFKSRSLDFRSFNFRSIKIRPTADFLLLTGAYTAMSLAFVTATRWTTAANAIALQSTAPAWVFLLSGLAARRVPWRHAPAIALILAGLAVVLAEPGAGLTMRGNLLAAASGLLFALTTIFFARVRRPPVEVIFSINLAAALVLFLANPAAYRPAQIPPRDWLMLAYLGSVQIGLGLLLYYAALRRIPASQAQVLALLEPLLNPIWVFLAIGEVPSRHGFAGGAMVLCGILADSLVRRKKGGTPPRKKDEING